MPIKLRVVAVQCNQGPRDFDGIPEVSISFWKKKTETISIFYCLRIIQYRRVFQSKGRGLKLGHGYVFGGSRKVLKNI